MMIPDAKAAVDEMRNEEGSHKEGTQKNESKVHFGALMDMRHIQKYEYIPKTVRKNNLKCGHKYEYIPGNVRFDH